MRARLRVKVSMHGVDFSQQGDEYADSELRHSFSKFPPQKKHQNKKDEIKYNNVINNTNLFIEDNTEIFRSTVIAESTF